MFLQSGAKAKSCWVLYRSAFDLAQDLAEAQATGTRKDLVGRLCKMDLLVLEDLGMRRLPATAVVVFYCHDDKVAAFNPSTPGRFNCPVTAIPVDS